MTESTDRQSFELKRSLLFSMASVATLSVSLVMGLPGELGTPKVWASDGGGLVPVDPPGTRPKPWTEAPVVPELPPVRISGPNDVTRFNTLLGTQYKEQVPGANVEISSRGVDEALDAVQDGTVDVAVSDRPLTDQEMNEGLIAVPIGGSLAYVYNSSNPSDTTQPFLEFVEDPNNQSTVQQALSSISPNLGGNPELANDNSRETLTSSEVVDAANNGETATASAPEMSNPSNPSNPSTDNQSGEVNSPSDSGDASVSPSADDVAQVPENSPTIANSSAEGGTGPNVANSNTSSPPSAANPSINQEAEQEVSEPSSSSSPNDSDIALVPSPGAGVTTAESPGRSFPWGWLLVPMLGLPLLFWLRRGKSSQDHASPFPVPQPVPQPTPDSEVPPTASEESSTTRLEQTPSLDNASEPDGLSPSPASQEPASPVVSPIAKQPSEAASTGSIPPSPTTTTRPHTPPPLPSVPAPARPTTPPSRDSAPEPLSSEPDVSHPASLESVPNTVIGDAVGVEPTSEIPSSEPEGLTEESSDHLSPESDHLSPESKDGTKTSSLPSIEPDSSPKSENEQVDLSSGEPASDDLPSNTGESSGLNINPAIATTGLAAGAIGLTALNNTQEDENHQPPDLNDTSDDDNAGQPEVITEPPEINVTAPDAYPTQKTTPPDVEEKSNGSSHTLSGQNVNGEQPTDPPGTSESSQISDNAAEPVSNPNGELPETPKSIDDVPEPNADGDAGDIGSDSSAAIATTGLATGAIGLTALNNQEDPASVDQTEITIDTSSTDEDEATIDAPPPDQAATSNLTNADSARMPWETIGTGVAIAGLGLAANQSTKGKSDEVVAETIEPGNPAATSISPSNTQPPGQGQIYHQQLTIDSQKNTYLLDEQQLAELQSFNQNTVALDSGCYLISIDSENCSYGTHKSDSPKEPLAMLRLYGGRFVNRKTNVETNSTWTTLNGYNDVLSLDVLEPTNLSAMVFDSSREGISNEDLSRRKDNSSQITLRVLKDEE